jgi:hypothetical protein
MPPRFEGSFQTSTPSRLCCAAAAAVLGCTHRHNPPTEQVLARDRPALPAIVLKLSEANDGGAVEVVDDGDKQDKDTGSSEELE